MEGWLGVELLLSLFILFNLKFELVSYRTDLKRTNPEAE